LPKTVLCVDDDLQIFEELRDRLQDGEILIHTDDLADAFAIVTEEEPDLVVLELELRDGNGLDLLERVRNEGGPLASVSTLVVTRCGRTPGLYGRAVQLGVVDYLMKPVVYSQLVASVEESLAQKSPQAAGDEGVATGLGSGRLRDLPLPELLDRVYRSGESGVLIVGDARARTGIQIRNGSPAAVTLSRPEALHDFLVRSGRILAEDLSRARERLVDDSVSVEDSLLELGVIDDYGLDEALQECAREEILTLFELPKGRFRFEAGRRLKGARSLDITCSAQSLIVRGVLAWSPLDTIRSALTRYGDLHAVTGAIGEPDFDDVPFSDAQRDFVTSLSSDRKVVDFLDGSEFEQRTLYAFAILGVIDLSPDAMLLLDDVLLEAPSVEAASGAAVDYEREHEREMPAEAPTHDIADADLDFENDLFESTLEQPAFASEPPRDRSFEDDLFEKRIFEEDSFEGEMVEAEPAPVSPRPDTQRLEPSLVEIEEVLAGVSAYEPEPAIERPPSTSPELQHQPEREASHSEEGAGAAVETPPTAELEIKPTSKVQDKIPAQNQTEEKPGKKAKRAKKAQKNPKRNTEKNAETKTKKRTHKKTDSGIEQNPETTTDTWAQAETKPETSAEAKPETRAEKSPANKTRSKGKGKGKGKGKVERDAKPRDEEAALDRLAPLEAPQEPRAEAVEPQPAAAADAEQIDAPVPEQSEPPISEPECELPSPEPAQRSAEVVGAESNKYEIAPTWTVQTDAHERLEIARRIQKGLDRRYGHLLERHAEAALTEEEEVEQAAPEGSAARALEAESWFHKGREQLKAKMTDKAVEAFGMAAHLEPAEGEYVAHLGYALYVARPDDEMVRQEALEHIARGIKLSPDREISYVYLGRIFKVMGDNDVAKKMFSRALQIRPHCREASVELRLMESRERKKTSFLGRFRK
jgi:DNA-binding response OmpR family regulator/tetratricopeptide (TPR) repeat protein